MATTRNEISKNRQYYLNKHRYLELRHFCMQYPIWKKANDALWSMHSKSIIDISAGMPNKSWIESPIDRILEARNEFISKMEMVEQAAIMSDDVLAPWILKCVTEGLSYDKMYARDSIPCSRSKFYILCRKFFWTLSKLRN